MDQPRPQRVHFIAGASGSGTSTKALQLQRRWVTQEGSRPAFVISTDVVRAQLRAVLDEADHPDLFGESFDLPARAGDVVVDGVSASAFRRQCDLVLRGVDAGLAYALTEGWDVIVEGVHLVPGMYAEPADVTVTRELLVVEDPAVHAGRFQARDLASDGRRPAEHYVRNLDRISVIQGFLAEQWVAIHG